MGEQPDPAADSALDNLCMEIQPVIGFRKWLLVTGFHPATGEQPLVTSWYEDPGDVFHLIRLASESVAQLMCPWTPPPNPDTHRLLAGMIDEIVRPALHDEGVILDTWLFAYYEPTAPQRGLFARRPMNRTTVKVFASPTVSGDPVQVGALLGAAAGGLAHDAAVLQGPLL